MLSDYLVYVNVNNPCHQILDMKGKTKKNLLLVFRVAYEVGIFEETPSRQSLIDFGYLEEDLGNDTTFSNYLTNEFKFKDAKEKGKTLWSNELYFEIQKLKEEVCI